MADVVSFLSFSCPHCPLEDREAIEWFLGLVVSLKPDYIIHHGDGHEASAASRFPDEEKFTLKEEFYAHNELLKKIRLAASDKGKLQSKLIFLPGNHDDNILDRCRIDPKLRELCDYHYWEPELVDHWKEPAKYVYNRRQGTFSLGQVTFGHGWETGVNADEFHALRLAQEYGLYVGGHLHKWTPLTRCFRTRTLPLNRWYINPGCMRGMIPHYMRRHQNMMWGQGAVYGKAELVKSPRLHRCWEAEAIKFRTAEEMFWN